jgi:hypothetical protein
MAGHDPLIHYGKPMGAITSVLDSLGAGGGDPSAQEVHWLWKRLMKAARVLKEQQQRDSVFSRTMFRLLVAAAAELATEAGMIAP